MQGRGLPPCGTWTGFTASVEVEGVGLSSWHMLSDKVFKVGIGTDAKASVRLLIAQ